MKKSLLFSLALLLVACGQQPKNVALDSQDTLQQTDSLTCSEQTSPDTLTTQPAPKDTAAAAHNYQAPDAADVMQRYQGEKGSRMGGNHAGELLFPHGKTRFQISALRHLQCNQVCLPLGSNFCRIPCQKASGGETLQCCHIPCRQEARSTDLRHGEVRATIQAHHNSLFLERRRRRSTCHTVFVVVTFSASFQNSRLTFNS